MSINKDEIPSNIKERYHSVRARTWTSTVAILVTLAFTILVKITTNQQIDFIDFVLVAMIQIVTHCLYFPDGELYGQKNPVFIANKNAYNEKASDINQQKKIKRLREYCKIEFEERKKRYIANECGALNITLEELEILRQKSEDEIKHLKSYEFTYVHPETGEEQSKLIFFSRIQREKLYNLIFKKLPIEQNYPETIMSAVENNGNKAIKDGSIFYKTFSYGRRIFKAFILGAIFAYVGYKLQDGIGIPEIMQILTYLTTTFMTAVFAFTSGETCSKVYKSRFYVELINFIDGFNEWDSEVQMQENILKEEKHEISPEKPEETEILSMPIQEEPNKEIEESE